MVMLEGVGTFVVLLDVKLTVTPPVGAACDNVTVKLADRPKYTEGLLSAMLTTVTGIVVLASVVAPPTPPTALAVIVDVPAATPVKLKVVLVPLAAIEADAGTVAAPVLLELKFTTNPDGTPETPPVGAWPPVKFKVTVDTLPTPITGDNGELAIVGAVVVTR